MRLKAHGSTTSPKTALELLRRIQQHRAIIGEHTYTGISKTTQEQLDLCSPPWTFQGPEKRLVVSFLPIAYQVKQMLA